MTQVIVVRHAKPYGDSLSEEGIQTQREMSQLLLDKGLHPTAIYTSPLTRAQETAAILSEYLGGNVRTESALESSTFDPEILLSLITSGATTLFVGHDPTLADFVNQLVGESIFLTGMAKSSAAIVTFPEKIAWGEGKLVAYHKPMG